MILNGIILIVLSLLAVPSLLLSKKPDAKDLLDKLVPVQGWIGVVAFLWGLFGIVGIILNLGYLSFGLWGILWWVTWTLYALVITALGFILGYSLIAKYVLSKNEATAKKGEEMLGKLQGYQGKLGIIGIIVGIWCIAYSFIYTAMYVVAVAVS